MGHQAAWLLLPSPGSGTQCRHSPCYSRLTGQAEGCFGVWLLSKPAMPQLQLTEAPCQPLCLHLETHI